MIHDLNGDGLQELVLAGHRGAWGAGFCTSMERSSRWQPYLAMVEIDILRSWRHRQRRFVDIYCTTGADRGRVGARSLGQVEPMMFQSVPVRSGLQNQVAAAVSQYSLTLIMTLGQIC